MLTVAVQRLLQTSHHPAPHQWMQAEQSLPCPQMAAASEWRVMMQKTQMRWQLARQQVWQRGTRHLTAGLMTAAAILRRHSCRSASTPRRLSQTQMASQMMPLNQLPSNTAQRNPPRGSTSRRHALPPPPPLSMEPPVVPEVHSWRRDRRPSQHSLHPPAAPLHQQLLLQQAGRQMRRDAVLQRQPRQRAARLPRQQHCRRRLRLYRGRQWHLQLTGRAPLGWMRKWSAVSWRSWVQAVLSCSKWPPNRSGI
mmetsp:Transcript_14126/g.42640  ORF Transcript_14126/g.42640 Transcript_14126/m.42640 type:complete len:252 (+) Transcript_14126:195-950(+)